ncbi:MAG: efflux RND transporter periplasmic adaptor subunit [Woeseia sp.]
MPSRSALVRLAMLAVCVSLVAGCGVGEARVASTETTTAPLPVVGVSAYITDLYATYQATSTLSADGDAAVPARVSGEVIALLVEEGDRVVQGQLLARLDGQRLALQVQQSDAEFTLRRTELRRQQRLHEHGLVSAASFDSLQYDVEALAAALELDQLNFSYTEIRAPINGVISSRDIKLGQYLKPGDLAFRISDTTQLLATVRVPQNELRHFQVELPLTLQVKAAGSQEYAALIDRISPVVDRSDGTFRVTTYVDNANGELAPGMFARISVRYEEHVDTVALPETAVIEEDGVHVVYVISNGQAERREIVPGVRDRGQVQIVSGVSAGEVVISNGSAGVRDGTAVVAMDSAVAHQGR